MNLLTPFEELTEEQLVAMTKEDIEFYRQREALNAGIILCPHPGPQPVKPDIRPTKKVFSLTGITIESGGRNLLFDSAEDAMKIGEAVLDVINRGAAWSTNYAYECGYNNEYAQVPDVNELGTKVSNVFTEQEFKEHREALAAYQVQNSEWTKLNNAHREFVSKTNDVCGYITDAINKARENISRREALLAAWEQYRVLDEEPVAATFFAKAYAEALEEIGMTVDQIRLLSAQRRGVNA